MPPFTPPPDNSCIKLVQSFQELVATPFADRVNALCWPRVLPGDFGEIVERLNVSEGITNLDEARLIALRLSAAGQIARDTLLADLELLRAHALAPELNCLQSYPRDDDAVVCTDVYSFHADRAPVAASTYLCTYYGPSSEGLRNEDAQRRVDLPATRAELLQLFGGNDDESFREFLSENCYDLHYAPAPAAQPYSFGLGNLWRIAIAYPGCPVPPCLHRAPENIPGQPPRLLLIS